MKTSLLAGLLVFCSACHTSRPQPKVGVVAGTELLQKSLFVEDPSLGTPTSIGIRPCTPDPFAEVALIGTQGAAFVTRDGIVRASIGFERTAATKALQNGVGRVIPVDVDGDGICEFMNRGGGWQPVSLFSQEGKLLWSYGGDGSAPDDMAAGDLDGDGKLEFVVGLNAAGGLVRLDKDGRVQWKRAATNVFQVEIMDINGDGRPKIVHNDHGAGITFRDSQGTILRTIKHDLYYFTMVRWPDPKVWNLLVAEPGLFRVLNFEGQEIARLPVSNIGIAAQAIPVSLGCPDGPCLAISVGLLQSQNRSNLYVFNRDNKRIYEEVLEGSNAALAALPAEKPGSETLLVGAAGGKVFRYTLTGTPSVLTR